MNLITVVNGHLLIGKRSFPLTSSDIDVYQFSYTGKATLQGNRMRIIVSRSTIYDFEIGAATQDSLEYEDGYEHGLKQKRLYVPKQCSTSFYYGLLDAHREKGS